MSQSKEKYIVPFFQGKMDNFCAIYAVINTIHLLRNVKVLDARTILNEALFEESRNPLAFLQLLNHRVDYSKLVERMLDRWSSAYRFSFSRPFAPLYEQEIQKENFQPYINESPQVCTEVLWKTLEKNVNTRENKIVLFRFCRFSPGESAPIVDHWSTICDIQKDADGNNPRLQLFDCSIESSGRYSLPKDIIFSAPFGALPPLPLMSDRGLIPRPEMRKEYIMVPPEHIYVLQRHTVPGTFPDARYLPMQPGQAAFIPTPTTKNNAT